MRNFIRYIGSFIFPLSEEKRKSEVSGEVEVVYSAGKYLLDSTHVNYSFGGLHLVFRKAFRQFDIRHRQIENALILGFGGGSAADILEHEYGKRMAITGVEKDPAVVELAAKYFSAGTYSNLTLLCQDAHDFVFQSNGSFDLIVMDVFVDLNVPDKFYEEAFIGRLKNLLSSKGILFFNVVIYNEQMRQKGALLFKRMNALLGKTEWCRIKIGSTENWVFVCDQSEGQDGLP